MTESSNIRKLLCDPDLGLIPHLDKSIKDLQASLLQDFSQFKLAPYDFEFGHCHTHKSTNESKPLVTQLISLRFSLTGQVADKLQLFLLAAELQNHIDIKLIEWSALERRQYDIHGIPLKQPVTKIEGDMDYQVPSSDGKSCQITLHRQFEVTYLAHP